MIGNSLIGSATSGPAVNGLGTTKKSKLSLHGVLLLDKPIGLSSNDALQKVKRLLIDFAKTLGITEPEAAELIRASLKRIGH